VLAKAMNEKSLRQVQASIAAKKVTMSEEDARLCAKRALQFKLERGRVPDINATDPYEKYMAQGVVAFARYRAQTLAIQARGAPV
jgi:HEPN domain-containing protein